MTSPTAVDRAIRLRELATLARRWTGRPEKGTFGIPHLEEESYGYDLQRYAGPVSSGARAV
jgi:hypothetical protein